MSIEGKVYTSLNMYKNEKWPTKFVEVPKIGSGMKSLSGKKLKVIGITHCQSLSGIPFIEIKLAGMLYNN